MKTQTYIYNFNDNLKFNGKPTSLSLLAKDTSFETASWQVY